MNKNPFKNAIAAIVYIVLVASLMFYGPEAVDAEDSVLAPIAMLSLFVLSAAVMGYIFCFQPIQMYLDGEKKEAAKLFVQTVIYFAVPS